MTRFLTLLATAAALSGTAAAADAKIDRGHSGVLFKAHHFSAGYTWGRFNDFEGTVSMDGNALTGVNIAVKTESIDTGIDKRDKHLRSPDFFDAAAHPELTFVSTQVTEASPGTYTVVGDLTLHGVTKSYTVEMTRTGEADLPVMVGGGHATGWETTFQISQTDHGMTYDGIGDTAYVLVNLEVKS